MPDAAFVDVACDPMNEAALIFAYRGHRFGVDLHDGRFRFNVDDPACPDDILEKVLSYADQMLSGVPCPPQGGG